MKYLSAGDWLVILAYLVGIIWFGSRFGRGQRNTRDYFLGNRNIPWWGVGLSIVATETSALTFIGVPALAYGGDLTFLQVIIGYVLARLLLALFLVPHYFRGELYSPYPLFEQAFGPGARRLASIFFLVSGTLAAGVRVYVTCIPIDLMMGDFLERCFGDAIVGAVILFVFLSLTYTFLGGIKAVVWTDAVQFMLLLGGGIFAFCYLPTLVAGGWAGAWKQAAWGGKLDWLDPAFRLRMPFNLWMGVIGATFMVMSTHGADQLIVQRVLACRSVRDGRKALVLSAVIIFPLFLIFLLVGVFLWVYYNQVSPAIALPESQAGFTRQDYVFPVFILTAVPPVVRGLLIVAILSAAMSSVSSALSALASVLTMDLVKDWLWRGRSEDFYLRCSRAATCFWALLLVAVALCSRNVEFVLNWAFSLNGLTNGAMLGGLGLALIWKGRNSIPVGVGMTAAFLVMIGLSRFEWAEMVQGREQAMKVAWPWYTLAGTAVTLAVAWLTDRFLKLGAGKRLRG